MTRGRGAKLWNKYLDKELVPGTTPRKLWKLAHNRGSLFEQFLKQNRLSPDIVIAPHSGSRQVVIRTKGAATKLNGYLGKSSVSIVP